MDTSVTSPVNCAVIGGGPAGYATALALAQAGVEVTLLAPPTPAVPDRRTFALFPSSIRFLTALGVTPHLAQSEPLRGIRLVDDTGHLWRAPEVMFEARELDLPSFGLNVAHAELVRELERCVMSHPKINRLATSAVSIETGPHAVRIVLEDGRELATSLTVGADGARSPSRAAAAIETQRWHYDQAAIVTRFAHTRPHDGVSTEIHRSAGPCTVVPLPGRESALVWVERPAVARRLARLNDDEFCRALEQRLGGLLGAVSQPDPRQLFDLSGLRATVAGASRVALVGEAAHVFPPIGAQGLNLGLRDVAALRDVVADACASGADIGGPEAMATYAASRQGDIAGRTFAVDLLDRSLLTSIPGVHLARGFGLHLINAVPSLRKAIMQAGMGPSDLPRMMRPA